MFLSQTPKSPLCLSILRLPSIFFFPPILNSSPYKVFRKCELFTLLYNSGRAIAQAVSHRFPTTAARVLAQVRSCGICGGQSGTEADFLLVPRSPLPILIPPIASCSSSSIIRGWYNRPGSGRRTKRTLSHPTPSNWKENYSAILPVTGTWNLNSQYITEIIAVEYWELYNKKLYILYWSQQIIRVIISRMIRWTGHVAQKKLVPTTVENIASWAPFSFLTRRRLHSVNGMEDVRVYKYEDWAKFWDMSYKRNLFRWILCPTNRQQLAV
jgi:hypothetical protein